MIKREPQEIADFFGGYVAQNRNGKWHLFYSSEPYIDDMYGTWEDDALGIYIDFKLIDVPEGHDWQTIYKPQKKQRNSDNKNRSCYQDFVDSDNNAPHQSEVHTHREYSIVCSSDPTEVIRKVNELMNKGWKCYGSLIIESLPETYDDSSYFYQAMVRGV